MIGERLKKARKRKNLKQVDVMKKIGINNKTLSGYENGISSPDYDSLLKLAELYEVSIGELLTGAKDSTEDEDSKLLMNSYFHNEGLNNEIYELLNMMSNNQIFVDGVEREIFNLFEGNMPVLPGIKDFDSYFKNYINLKNDEPDYSDIDIEEEFTKLYNVDTVYQAIKESYNLEWKKDIKNKLINIIDQKGLTSVKLPNNYLDLYQMLNSSHVYYKGKKLSNHERELTLYYLDTLTKNTFKKED